LTFTQFITFQNKLLTDTCFAWAAACIGAKVSAGKIYAVFGAGAGVCDIRHFRVAPFV